jgi:hypothetical protein
MRIVRIKHWDILMVLLGSLLVSSPVAAMVSAPLSANIEFDLRGIVARQLVHLTSPHHDPRHPASVIESWAAMLDRTLADWFAIFDNDCAPTQLVGSEKIDVVSVAACQPMIESRCHILINKLHGSLPTAIHTTC